MSDVAGEARALRVLGCCACVAEDDPRLRQWLRVGEGDLFCPAPGCGRALADDDWLAVGVSPAPMLAFSATSAG